MKILKVKGIFIMLFLVSVDSNMAANFIIFLSAISDYCMVCFFRKVFLKSDTAIALTSSDEQSRIRERNHSLKRITITQRFLFMKIANEMK